MSFEYDYIVDIVGWSGPSRLAGRVLLHQSKAYDALLKPRSQQLVKSADPGHRSSATVVVSNDELSPGVRFHDAHLADPLNNKEITVSRLQRGSAVASVVYVGVVESVSFSELEVVITLVEPSRSRSKRVDKLVDSVTWPNAKPSDVGQSIPVPVGNLKDARVPAVKWNANTRLKESVTASLVVGIPLENSDNFPSSGTVRIGDEMLSYASISPAFVLTGIARGVNSTEATDHQQGDTVIVVSPFQLGIDATASASTVIAANAVGDDGEKIPLALPDSHATANGVRVAQWDSTPMYDQPTGPISVASIGLDTDDGSTPPLNAGPGKWLEEAPGFSSSSASFAVLGNGESLKGKRIAFTRRLGLIKKVLLEVQHSGNKAMPPGAFVSTLDTVAVQWNGNALGNLVDADVIDVEYLDLAGHPPVFEAAVGAGVPVVVTHQAHLFGLSTPNLVGLPATQFEFSAAVDLPKIIDGNAGTFARLGQGFPGGAVNEINFFNPVLPPDAPLSTPLTRVLLAIAHGANGEPNITSQGTIRIFDGITPVSAVTAFTNRNVSVARSFDTLLGQPTHDALFEAWLSNGGAGRTLADLSGLRFVFNHILNDGAIEWAINSAFAQLTYSYTPAGNSQNPAINQFDITSLLPAALKWRDFEAKQAFLLGSAATSLRVYSVGLRIVYTPTEKRPADSMIVDINSAAIDTTKTPAQVIADLWQLPILGNNPASTINAAEVVAASAAGVTEGYVASTVNGLVRDEELWQLIQNIADECRLTVYILNGVLRMQFIQLLANLPAASVTLTKLDTGKAGVEFIGSDNSEGVVNVVNGKFDVTDFEGFRGTALERIDAASVSANGRKQLTKPFRWLNSLAQVNKTIDAILDRLAIPHTEITFSVDLLRRDDVSPLGIVALSLGWVSVSKAQLLELAEGGDHTIAIRARLVQ